MSLLIGQPVYQCVPNFSEGRRQDVVEAIAEAARSAETVQVIDYSADADHNRCVLTILGDAEGIYEAALAAVRTAVARIDMRSHSGVHPRIGALDVLPVVPLRNAGREDAVFLAERIGQALARDLSLPVYFYEWNARQGRKSTLPELRRGSFEDIVHLPLEGSRAPDCGPSQAHPTAGVSVVGARGPLVAYNVNLHTSDVRVAQEIARSIRSERGSLPELEGVRALGLFLASQNRAQVSLNLTHPEKTTLPEVFAYVQREAARRGVYEVESEIIGAIPAASLAGQSPESIHWRSFNPAQILDTWLGPLSPQSHEEHKVSRREEGEGERSP